MPLTHRNRRGQVYTVFQGQTKTGKAKYFVSRSDHSDAGEPIDQLPDGYELVESPVNSTVSIQRIRLSRVLPAERELVSRLVLQLTSYSVEHTVIEGDRIVVYVPDSDPALTQQRMRSIFGVGASGMSDWTSRHTRFTAMLRFTLKDEKTREFNSERYCFLGSREGWMQLTSYGPLEKVARRCIPKLGTEQFYELF